MVIIRIPKAISDLINQPIFSLHELINLAVGEIALSFSGMISCHSTWITD